MDLGEFTPQVVVNSMITPDSTIKVVLVWSKQIGDKSDYKNVEQFDAKIYENDQLIYEANNLKDSIVTTYHPQSGGKYRLEIEVPQYGIVSAETSIPLPPQSNVEYVGMVGDFQTSMTSGYRYFRVNDIQSESVTRSLIVQTIGLYEKISSKTTRSYFATNSFCDQFNTGTDSFESAMKGSSNYFGKYIRISYNNVKRTMPLEFSISEFRKEHESIFVGYDDFGCKIYDSIDHIATHIIVETIAPSDEYDKYQKTAYLQKSMDNIDPPIFNVNVPIYSNIENGVGIFAGFSSSKFTYKIECDEE